MALVTGGVGVSRRRVPPGARCPRASRQDAGATEPGTTVQESLRTVKAELGSHPGASQQTLFSTFFRQPLSYPTKFRTGVVKFARFGKMVGRSDVGTPNQFAKVAAYWSSEVVGIQRPSLVASSGPPSASVGKVPKKSPPWTPPPMIR